MSKVKETFKKTVANEFGLNEWDYPTDRPRLDDRLEQLWKRYHSIHEFYEKKIDKLEAKREKEVELCLATIKIYEAKIN